MGFGVQSYKSADTSVWGSNTMLLQVAHNFGVRITKCELCATFYGYEEQYL